MPEFHVTPDVLEHITMSMAKHFRALNDELTETYSPDKADPACILALGSAIATTLSSFEKDRGAVVESLNDTLAMLHQPWRLVSIS